MDAIECPYCGSDDVRWVAVASLYQCYECEDWFEDDVPDIEYVKPGVKTKLHREE